MARPETEIPFTVGDQERLKGIEGKINTLCGKMDSFLEKADTPFPRCAANMERIKSLESTRKKVQYVGGTFGIGFLLYWAKILFNHLVKWGSV